MADNPWLEAVSAKPPANALLADAISGLLTNVGASARESLSSADRPGATGGAAGLGTDAHGAWLQAWASFSGGRLTDAQEILQRHLQTRDRGFRGSNDLIDAELTYLSASVTAAHDLTYQAAELAAMARDNLLRFVALSRTKREDSARQVLRTLSTFTGPQIVEEWMSSGVPTEELLPAWAVTRGIDLLAGIARMRDAAPSDDDVIEDLLQDAVMVVEAVGAGLGPEQIAVVELAVGDCARSSDPHFALLCFASVLRRVGDRSRLGLQAMTNIAMMTGSPPRGGWERLADAVETVLADRTAAAALRVMGHEFNWRESADPSRFDEILDAVRAQEAVLPADASARTLFAVKRSLEPGYVLLATVLAHDDDRSPERFDILMSVVQALLTGHRSAELDGAARSQRDGWDEWDECVLRSLRPAAMVRESVRAVTGLGVLHLIDGVDTIVWVMYGTARRGEFFARWGLLDARARSCISELRALMDQQLQADHIDDLLAMSGYDRQIEAVGEQLGGSLPDQLRWGLSQIDFLLYGPHPGSGLDEFPLSAVRMEGKWLTESITTTRISTVPSLQALLSPTFVGAQPNTAAVIVRGSDEAGGQSLRGSWRHSRIAQNLLERSGFEAVVADGAGVDDVDRLLDGGCGIFHYVGHGLADDVLEALPLPNGESFDPARIEDYLGYRFPFVFLCACVAARIRYSEGGHFIGLLSGLIDRGAPAGIAFMTPIGERHAYTIAETFYRFASQMPFGAAVARTVSAVRAIVPTYAWMALTAYGDPLFELAAMARTDAVPGLRDRARSWHSTLRSYIVLRTSTARERFDELASAVPEEIRGALLRLLAAAFTPDLRPEELDEVERLASTSTSLTDAERLTLWIAASLARIDAVQRGRTAQFGTLVPRMQFLFRAGAALFDLQVHGAGLALWGIHLAAVDRHDHAREPLWEALDKLWLYEQESMFIADLLAQCRAAMEVVDPVTSARLPRRQAGSDLHTPAG